MHLLVGSDEVIALSEMAEMQVNISVHHLLTYNF